MAPAAGQAVIVVHGPAVYFVGGAPKFLVSIDGRRVGTVQTRSAAEFPGIIGFDSTVIPPVNLAIAVQPGDHTVAVTTGWLRSRPAQVSTTPGLRTDLTITGPSGGLILKWFLPILVVPVAVMLIITALSAGGVVGLPSVEWYIAITVAIWGGYNLLATVLVSDYWAVWRLEPVSTSRAPQGESELAASADRPRDDGPGRSTLPPA
jgi:hypothetical protein